MTVTSPPGGPGLADVRVMRAMHPGVLACGRDASLRDVARLMATHSIHAAVVFGRHTDDVPWGVVSDLDLVTAALAGDADEQTAASIAASPAVFVSTDDTLERAAQLLTEHATSHLIVLDADTSHPVGVLSTLDVAAALAGVQHRSAGPRG